MSPSIAFTVVISVPNFTFTVYEPSGLGGDARSHVTTRVRVHECEGVWLRVRLWLLPSEKRAELSDGIIAVTLVEDVLGAVVVAGEVEP